MPRYSAGVILELFLAQAMRGSEDCAPELANELPPAVGTCCVISGCGYTAFEVWYSV